MAVEALFTQLSMRPNSRSATSARCSTSRSSATSVTTWTAAPPAASMSATTRWSARSLRAASTAEAPRCAASFAVASPIPLEAPVTTTTCSDNGLSFSSARMTLSDGGRVGPPVVQRSFPPPSAAAGPARLRRLVAQSLVAGLALRPEPPAEDEAEGGKHERDEHERRPQRARELRRPAEALLLDHLVGGGHDGGGQAPADDAVAPDEGGAAVGPQSLPAPQRRVARRLLGGALLVSGLLGLQGQRRLRKPAGRDGRAVGRERRCRTMSDGRRPRNRGLHALGARRSALGSRLSALGYCRSFSREPRAESLEPTSAP